ncbi:MAG: riboflavin biosynthesis protein RibF [Candidatus Aminicenantes bacterium RBG_16_63_16]|nr:MAG: riboflavin biosynthesis protein RibF [Candidatus Aminicenantes bacterium RBG_16_63_16]
MQVVRELDFRPLFGGRTAVAAGNFDGLHLGHQKILRFLVERARRESLRAVVLTFSPHPEKVLGRSQTAMIQTLPQRLEGFRSAGVQAVLVAPFTRTFAGLSVTDFIERVLVGSLGARDIIIGSDFRFGRGRLGGIRDLKIAGRGADFRVHPVSPVRRRGRVVSSSHIRQLLAAGAVEEAAVFLGHPYEIVGRVVGGSARGRTLGYPTANLKPENEIIPAGVFLTSTVVGGKEHPSVTNIGTRPTFGCGPVRVETFLLNYRGDLYRRRVGLRFIRKLRSERAFPSAESLAGQIRSDVRAAGRYFRYHGG